MIARAMAVPILAVLATAGAASAETISESMEGGVEVEITHPDSVVAGRDFAVSFLVRNNGWEDKEQIMIVFGPGGAIVPAQDSIVIDRLAEGGAYGETVNFGVPPGTEAGIYFLNLEYSQVLLENNTTPRNATRANLALLFDIKERAGVAIHVAAPESIFTQAEFPITVEVLAEDEDIADIQVEIIAPDDIEFRGQTLHAFSSVAKGEPLSITSRIVTPTEEIHTEYEVPFQVLVSYTDGAGVESSDSQTVSVILRPRMFMEITGDGGIWVGDFFIAPYVSVGTIIGIPAGAILSLLIRRAQKSKGTA